MNVFTEEQAQKDMKWHAGKIFPYFLGISSRGVGPFFKKNLQVKVGG